jgi:hypothetical protein
LIYWAKSEASYKCYISFGISLMTFSEMALRGSIETGSSSYYISSFDYFSAYSSPSDLARLTTIKCIKDFKLS